MEKDLSAFEWIGSVGPNVSDVLLQLTKIKELLNTDLELTYSENENEMLIRDQTRTIIIIDKHLNLVKPLELLRIKGTLKMFNYSTTRGHAFTSTLFYKKLLTLTTLETDQDFFIYYYLICIMEYLNLECDDIVINKTKDNQILIISSKYEFVYVDEAKEKTEYKKITIFLKIPLQTDEIKITKIYNEGICENSIIRTYDLIF